MIDERLFDEIEWLSYAVFHAYRFSRWFFTRIVPPEEADSICVLAALEARDSQTRQDAASIIRRVFRKQIEDYGFVCNSITGTWDRVETALGSELKIKTRIINRSQIQLPWDWRPCGVSGCRVRAWREDSIYGALCRQHYNYVQFEKEQGSVTPYANIRSARRSTIKPVEQRMVKVECAACGSKLYRPRYEVDGKKRFFCGASCGVLHATRGYVRVSGELHHKAKLTETQVADIRMKLALNHNLRDLAKSYNVTSSTIASIRDRITWPNVSASPIPDNAIAVQRHVASRNGRAKLTADQVRIIREYLLGGASIAKTALEFGIGRTTVTSIRDGVTYKHVV